VNVYIDCETIPSQCEKVKASFIKDAKENFKAPSTLNKAQAAADLGITDAKAIKFTSKDELISQWEAEFVGSKAEQVGEDNWLKTSFDGGKGEIISLVFKLDGVVHSFTRDYKEKGSEYNLLTDFCGLIIELLDRKDGKIYTPFFIGHNVTFDLKFLFRRLVVLGINPKFPLPFNGRHGQHYFCTMAAWSSFGERISQDNLCEILGLEQKPDGIDGSKVWGEIQAGNVDRVLKYNQYDVETVEKLHNKLNFIG
jgi:hypothetical protein